MCVCDLIRFVWTVYRDEEKVIMESKKTRVKKSSWQLHLLPDHTKIVWSTRLWNAAKKNLICVLTNVFHRYVSESLCRFRAKFQYVFKKNMMYVMPPQGYYTDPEMYILNVFFWILAFFFYAVMRNNMTHLFGTSSVQLPSMMECTDHSWSATQSTYATSIFILGQILYFSLTW